MRSLNRNWISVVCRTGRTTGQPSLARYLSTEAEPAAVPAEATGVTNFSELGILDSLKSAITNDIKYEKLTEVQRKAIPVLLNGADSVVRSKSGSGKTLAYMIPALQGMESTRSAKGVRPIVVLTPSMHLVSQIAEEVAPLCKALDVSIAALGESSTPNKDKAALTAKNLGVIIATPDRLKNCLRVSPDISGRVQKASSLVLDDADVLFSFSMQRETHNTLNLMRPPLGNKLRRQTLMFASTITPALQAAAEKILGSNHGAVDTTGELMEVSPRENIKQTLMVCPLASQAEVLLNGVEGYVRANKGKHKVIVFFPTTAYATLMAHVFNECGLPVLLYNHQKSPTNRAQTTEQYKSKPSILFLSSITGKGSADFSDATLIVQVGATDRLTYHRRQSHAAASGAESILLCSPCDEPTVTHELNGFPLESQSAPALTPNGNQSFMRATSNFKLKANIRGAFEWFLRTYKSPQFNFTDEALVEAGKEFCKGLGQHSVPELPVNIVDSIGLRRTTPGLLVGAEVKRDGKFNNRDTGDE